MKFAFLQEPPFCFTNAAGAVEGCDVELARVVCDRLGRPFDPIETEFADLLPGLAEGRWSMTTGLFVSDERRKLVDFTRPIWSLSDGLLVAVGNPRGLTGYRSVATDPNALLGVITDQIQHRTALENGVPSDRIRIFATQAEAADAALAGAVHAYASVAMAHRGYIARHPGAALAVVEVPPAEKGPAFGAFALAKSDAASRRDIDACLGEVLGTSWHHEMMGRYGFADADVERILRGGERGPLQTAT
ncbi:transporter substrate-binding domain-containing protein [Kumtagia ephedrae]|uniref:ABC transporter substrate-binding protein n=1 Tax=Kumtagia ephedrae TaxID=2116701 RepID=A0A2P7ST85_9HYPH|nr:transporter substrate-binding domain-containing protein [Mesorhizobium ephedrae]PSJ65686.1 ABC transporter substrate-binding protein [Mesorhizobium ephedrae]